MKECARFNRRRDKGRKVVFKENLRGHKDGKLRVSLHNTAFVVRNGDENNLIS